MKRIVSILLMSSTVLLSACQPISTPEARWQHTPSGTVAAALDGDGSLAATSALDQPILLWDQHTRQVLYSFHHHSESSTQDSLVYLLTLSADGRRLASAEQRKYALWDTVSGQSLGLWPLEDSSSSITDLALSADGRFLLLGQSNGIVLHIDTQSGRQLEFLGHSEKVNAIALSPNGRYALSGGNDYVAYLWDTQTGQPVHRFIHGSRISQVALDSQGRYGFTADSRKQARVWDLRSGKPVSTLKVAKRQGIFTSARFSPDGSLLLTGSPDRHLRLWQVNSGEQLAEWFVPPKTRLRPSGAVIYDVAFDGASVVTESSTGFGARWALPSELAR